MKRDDGAFIKTFLFHIKDNLGTLNDIALDFLNGLSINLCGVKIIMNDGLYC